MVIDHPLHLSHCHDGPHWVWSAGLATSAINGLPRWWLYIAHLVRREHLPRWNFNTWYQSQLQGAGEVVYAKRVGFLEVLRNFNIQHSIPSLRTQVLAPTAY